MQYFSCQNNCIVQLQQSSNNDVQDDSKVGIMYFNKSLKSFTVQELLQYLYQYQLALWKAIIQVISFMLLGQFIKMTTKQHSALGDTSVRTLQGESRYGLASVTIHMCQYLKYYYELFYVLSAFEAMVGENELITYQN